MFGSSIFSPDFEPGEHVPGDPFSGLSRNQRMMLGFAALRDAGAALDGQQSNYFGKMVGGIQDRRKQAAEMEFRRAQEARLIAQSGQQAAGASAQTQARLIEALGEIDKRRALYGSTPETEALRASILKQLGMGTTATQSAVPEAVTSTPDGQPAMNLPLATQIASDRASSAEDIQAALQFALLHGQGDLAKILDANLRKATAAEGQASQVEQGARAREISTASSVLLGDMTLNADGTYTFANVEMNERGDVENIINVPPEITRLINLGWDGTLAGLNEMGGVRRFIAGAGSIDADTRSLIGAIDAIRGNAALAKLISSKSEGATYGALSQQEMKKLESAIGTLDLLDPVGTADTLSKLRIFVDIYERERNAASGTPTPGSPTAAETTAAEMTDDELLRALEEAN